MGIHKEFPEALSLARFGVLPQRLVILALGCSVHTWDANSLSLCSSKFRLISSNELPPISPAGLNRQPHSEQPQPRKCSSSIHIRSRRFTRSFRDHSGVEFG
jgi:hypothetical protein